MSRRNPRHPLKAALALGVVVPLLVLGGCSDDDPEPRIAPTTSTSPSNTGSPSPTPTGPVEPTMPAAARQHTAAGAKAFVKFYWEMVNYAQVSGVLQPLVRLGDENCGACSGGVDFLRKIFNAGGVVRGGAVTVSNLEAIRVKAGSHVSWRVLADVTNTRQVVDLPGKRKDETYPAGKLSLQLIIDPQPNGWTVGYWDEAPK
ncbi:MAG: hypothetical protein JWO76_914 [Nocardioides sp.]|nr:hypothetical protein [Nocardioides sp.]